MENKEIISRELMEIAPSLASISRQMPFALPEGYFDVFPVTMLSEVAPRKNSFTVPEGYFDSLPAILLEKAKASSPTHITEEENFSLLNTISKKMPYTAPAGYFEKFEVELPGKGAPVIPIWHALKRAAGWAVAASLLAVMGIFGYRYLSNPGTEATNASIVKATATQSNDAYFDSLVAEQLADALSELDDSHLKAELDGYGVSGKSVAQYYTANNIEKALKSMSDEEISKSLELESYIYIKS